jgi:predicted ATP-binding protein involved in virulence
MRITRLKADGFPPFADLDITFPKQERKGSGDDAIAEVHLFTGENGTGKTRLLAALAGALGNRSALARRDAGGHTTLVVEFKIGPGNRYEWNSRTTTDDAVLRIASGQHTGCYAYAGHMPLKSHIMTPLAEVKLPEAPSLLDFDRTGDEGKMISQCLYNFAMQSAAESFDEGEKPKTSRWRRLLTNVQKCIAEVTGGAAFLLPLAFPQTTLQMKVFGAAMNLNQVPDGLKAILSWAGDIIVNQELRFPNDPDPLGKPMIILIDEPETHLHPAWQRRVLPALQKLFRNAQIFVVTHSPFIASSLNDGWIHKFTRGEDGLVRVTTEEARKGDTYVDAVEDIMGLAPIERFDPESQALLEKFYALLKKVAQGKLPRAELDLLAEKLRDRGGEVASVTETELSQLEAGELVEK